MDHCILIIRNAFDTMYITAKSQNDIKGKHENTFIWLTNLKSFYDHIFRFNNNGNCLLSKNITEGCSRWIPRLHGRHLRLDPEINCDFTIKNNCISNIEIYDSDDKKEIIDDLLDFKYLLESERYY
jgi:hypothetical protein